MKRYLQASLLIIVLWTAALYVLYSLNDRHLDRSLYDLVLNTAKTGHDKDLLYRQWATMHGGVYAPETEETPPNEYLKHLDERDITTPSGRRLTLINPAYMTRQVHELGDRLYNYKGHITSLDPIRAENAPDEWETQALLKFEEGAAEISSIELLEGEEYLRYMQPMYTEQGCLKCHSEQNYAVGDIRGGISVSVRMADFESLNTGYRKGNAREHLFIYLLGLLIILVASFTIRKIKIRQHQTFLSLLEARKKFEFAVSGTNDGLWDWNLKTNEIYFSPRWKEILGYSDSEIRNDLPEWERLTRKEELERSREQLQKCIKSGSDRFRMEFKMFHKAGHEVDILSRALLIKDEQGKPVRVVGTHTDLTELKKQERLLSKSMKEKEVLLKELYHRTKNNMQVISSLLKLQVMYSDNEEVRYDLMDAERRIASMALVHKKLYQSHDLSRISLKDYISDLCSNTLSSFEHRRSDISLNLDLDEISVDIEVSIPLGLVINELLMNSIKYAFVERSGLIGLKLRTGDSPRDMILEYLDDGPGFPEGFNPKTQDSLGLKLLYTIVENQLHGTIEFPETDKGMKCRILFSWVKTEKG